MQEMTVWKGSCMAENTSGESEVSVSVVMAWNSMEAPSDCDRQNCLKRDVLSHFAQVTMRDHSVQQKSSVLIRKKTLCLLMVLTVPAFPGT